MSHKKEKTQSAQLLKIGRTMCRLWHKGQVRQYTEEPYHTHPIAVGNTLEEIGAPEEVIVAAYLHDVIEDCGVNYRDISGMFGLRVADLVLMVSDVSKPEDGKREIRKAIDRAHVAKADFWGKTLKLADLIDNTASIVEHAPGFADRKSVV